MNKRHDSNAVQETSSDPRVSFYAGQIDPTQFGIPADYLRQPDSPIQVLLHVKDRAQLPQVAAQVSAAQRQGGQRPGWLLEALDPWLRDGSVKLSTREPLPPAMLRATVEPANVPRNAACEVIYLPPCYLLHTPGLFEGTLHTAEKSQSRAQQADLRQRRTHGHEMEY